MTRKQYTRRWVRAHATWERRAAVIVQSTMDGLYRSIPVDQINKQNWESTIILNIPEEAVRDMIIQIWEFAGRNAGEWAIDMFNERIGQKSGVRSGLEVKNKPLFNQEFSTLLRDYFFKGEGGKHIVSVTGWARKQLIQEIGLELGLFGEYSLEQLRDTVQRMAGKGYPRWAALRIARTEVTGAANWAALQGAKQGKYRVAKEWISIQDKRTRSFERGDKFDHVILDGERQGLTNYFEQNGVRLQFPGDPNAIPAELSAAMVINCRCSIAIVPVRDSRGRLVLADGPDTTVRNLAGVPNMTDGDTKFKAIPLEDWEDLAKSLDHERGAYYDINTGEQLYEMKGTKKSVPVKRIGRDLPKGPGGKDGYQLFYGNLFTHNHPQSGYDYPGYKNNEFSQSFSDADVSIFGYFGSQELRAVGSTGRVFRVFRTSPISEMAGDFIYRNHRWYNSVPSYFRRNSNDIVEEGWDWVDEAPTRKEQIKRKNYLLANAIHWTWERFFGQKKYQGLYIYEGQTHNPEGFDWVPKRNRRFLEGKNLPDTTADPEPDIDGEAYWNYIEQLPNTDPNVSR
jgi:hypothetical protein